MDAQQLTTWLVSLVLSAGTMAAIGTIVTSRRTARKIAAETRALDARTPAEVDSITVAGAERVVLMLQGANETLASENKRLFRENTRLHVVIRDLETKLESYRVRMEEAEAALASARREYEALHNDLEALRRVEHLDG